MVAALGDEVNGDLTDVGGEETADYANLSWERLGLITGDTLLFVRETEQARAVMQQTLANPPWQQVPAVASGRVLELEENGASGSFGTYSIEYLLDRYVEYVTR